MNIKKIAGTLLLLLLCVCIAVADMPPPPPGGYAGGANNRKAGSPPSPGTPSGPPLGGSPIGEGMILLLVLGAGYGGRKVYKYRASEKKSD